MNASESCRSGVFQFQSTLLIIGAIFSLLTLSLWSVLIGTFQLSLIEMISNPNVREVVLVSRLPRTFAVIIAGAVLGMLGCLSQTVMNNAFAEPTTLGTPQGIALGLLVASIIFPEQSLLLHMLMGCSAGLSSLLFLNWLIKRLRLADSMQLPLIGLVYSAILGAGATFLAFEYDRLQTLMSWLNGDFSTVLAGNYELLWGAFFTGLAVYLAASYFSLLAVGQTLASGLGVPYQRIAFLAMVMIALGTSLVVVTVGMISFLGLVIPNIVRQYVGDNLTHSLPWSGWLGAFLLLSCDILGRILGSPIELPASVVFGTFAAGLFLIMLWKGADDEY